MTSACRVCRIHFVLMAFLVVTWSVEAADTSPCPAAARVSVDAWFTSEVWAKVASQECIQCHKQGGDAEDSQLVLVEPGLASGKDRSQRMAANHEAFAQLAKRWVNNGTADSDRSADDDAADAEGRSASGSVPSLHERSYLLQKVTGQLDHGGNQVLPLGSTGYRILEQFVRRTNNPASTRSTPTPARVDARPFFDGVVMLDDRRLLRRATLSLVGRLPAEKELADIGWPSRATTLAPADRHGRVDGPEGSPTALDAGVGVGALEGSDAGQGGGGVEVLGGLEDRPTGVEAADVSDEGEVEQGRSSRRQRMEDVLLRLMAEDAFYDRLREGFNDIFLTQGIDGNPDSTVLSYEHFEKTRLWYQQYDLSHIEDEKQRRQAGYKLANDYRAALLEEPMQLIEHIVRNDRPFTELVTADYIMVSPYTARGYGVFEAIQDQFHDLEDPFEYLPVRLKALVGRNRSEDQESATGFYPHAGVLSTFQYLSRYPTTETNRNRLRARMYYQHFLGVDVLELAARVSDAAAVTAKFEIPTMQASECVICHKTLDPVAGLFQDYWRFDRNFAIYGRRPEGWFTDMFSPGFEGEDLPPGERWRALQWLGERTAQDPRFAVAMTEHAYSILTGRRPLLPPKDLDDPLYMARQRAYQEQRCEVERIARRFVDGGFQFKRLLADWVLSDFYRADGLETAAASPERRAELDDIGVVRMLSPEQLERKLTAVFRRPWGKLTEQTAMLYGGIDSKEVTERAADPSGAMGAIQRTLSNDVACLNVAYDFSRKPAQRVLFPDIEPDVLPGASPEADAKIRRTIVRLHQRVLGRYDDPDASEVDRTYRLFASIVADAAARKNYDEREAWSCRQGLERPVPDPHYTVRAWRAVVTYLLRQEAFLYE